MMMLRLRYIVGAVLVCMGGNASKALAVESKIEASLVQTIQSLGYHQTPYVGEVLDLSNQTLTEQTVESLFNPAYVPNVSELILNESWITNDYKDPNVKPLAKVLQKISFFKAHVPSEDFLKKIVPCISGEIDLRDVKIKEQKITAAQITALVDLSQDTAWFKGP